MENIRIIVLNLYEIIVYTSFFVIVLFYYMMIVRNFTLF